MSALRLISTIGLLLASTSAQYSATYSPTSLPNQTESGQEGYNICGTANSQTSMCQTAYFNNLNDFCVWAPPTVGVIGETERYEVAWCTKPGYGTRLIPEGTIQGAHWVETPDYVQITGWGDFTKMNIPAGDSGGELDPHGADGNGNPVGGIVFTNAFGGSTVQAHEWTNFMSATEFCFRVCKDGANAWQWCEHVYDVMGCAWNMPGDYSIGTFDSCDGDSGEKPGIYGGSTFHQGDANTPAPHAAPSKSSCINQNTISPNGAIATPTTSTSASASASGSTSSAVTLSTVTATATSGPSVSTSQASTSTGSFSASSSPSTVGTNSASTQSVPSPVILLLLIGVLASIL